MEKYLGADFLETMESARFYNVYLTQLLCKNVRGQKLLDFGAGRGLFAKNLREKGFHVECVEPDTQLAEHLRHCGFTVYPDIQFITKTYDSIYSVNVLEHIQNDTLVAHQLKDLLSPRGRLLIYVPAFEQLFSPLDKQLGHLRRYTKKTLLPLFSPLQTHRCEYVDSLGFVASLGLRWLISNEKPISVAMVQFYDRFIFPFSRRLDSICYAFFGKNIFYVGEKK